MLDVLKHRGPDDEGLWADEQLCLGHTRLAILDPTARGRQPFVTADGLGVLVFNGEVYNYLELRRQLENEGVSFCSGTDTEVVLYALHRWGVEAALRRFDGMFAIAYFDRRNRSLWLARDPMGIKPLFVSATRDELVFASEQKALLAQPGTAREPDPQAVTSLLLYERFDAGQTPFRNIESLLPGTFLRYQDGCVERHSYFDPLESLDMADIRDDSRSFSGSLDHLERALARSVEMHLASDVPLATMCSGGLDSGLVTTFAARSSKGLVSYVADIEGMRGEEARRARLVTDSAGAELRVVPVDRTAFLRALPAAVQACDQPFFFAQQVAAMLVAERIREDGFKVVLTGDGADELFGGYPWYAQEYRHWMGLARRARWIPDTALNRWLGRRVPWLAPVDLDRECEEYRLTDTPIEYVSTSFNTVLSGGLGRVLRQRAIFRRFVGLPPAERAFLSRNFEDMYVHLRESIETLDKVAMRHSVEARLPFLEMELMTLGFSLPVSHKYAGGRLKRLVYELGRKLLPPAVLDLPKIGFSMPAAMWRGSEQLLIGGRVADLLKWPGSDAADAARLFAHKPRYLFRLLGLEIWLRVCVEGEPPERLAEQLLATSQSP